MNIEEKIYEMVMKGARCMTEGEKIDANADLVDDLGFDSLSLVELITDIEVEFDIEIEEEEMNSIFKYGKLITFVQNKCITK